MCPGCINDIPGTIQYVLVQYTMISILQYTKYSIYIYMSHLQQAVYDVCVLYVGCVMACFVEEERMMSALDNNTN